MKRVLCTISIIAILVLSVLHAVRAQSATIDLSLTTNPLNPQPGQSVTITAQSFATDINQATMTWVYGGKQIASNVGQTSITVIAPTSGATGNVTVTASGGGFSPTTATILLQPASVDLLWEGAGSYVPPFYKGRALPSVGGAIRVVAIPSISAPRNLSYTWSNNSDALQSASGYNKSSVIIHNDVLIPTDQVAVTEDSGSFSGSDSATITPGDPQVVGYFNTDGFIDYANGSTEGLSTAASGAIVHFEPYFFSAPHNISQDLTVAFSDNNNNTLPSGDVANELRISRPDGGGNLQFNTLISTVTYSLQNSNKIFSVNFK